MMPYVPTPRLRKKENFLMSQVLPSILIEYHCQVLFWVLKTLKQDRHQAFALPDANFQEREIGF
jgi:hypothetical protein